MRLLVAPRFANFLRLPLTQSGFPDRINVDIKLIHGVSPPLRASCGFGCFATAKGVAELPHAPGEQLLRVSRVDSVPRFQIEG